MIEQLPGFSPGVVGAKVSGKLRHKDVNKALQWIDEVVAKRGECRMLIVFGDPWLGHAVVLGRPQVP